MKSIFVSSTFKDMQSERDILMRQVLPEVRQFAKQYGEAVRFVDLRWGVDTTNFESDEGARKVLSVCLDEINQSRPYLLVFLGQRYGWLPPKTLLQQAAKEKDFPLTDFDKSVTELEIEYGALSSEQKARCLFYFREPLALDELDEATRAVYADSLALLQQKQAALKERIIATGAPVRHYHASVDATTGAVMLPDDFAQMVSEDLCDLFQADFAQSAARCWQEKETLAAQVFLQQKAALCSARQETIDTMLAQLHAQDTGVLWLRGETGSGKSTLLCKLAKQLQQETLSPENKSTPQYQNEVLFIACGTSDKSQTSYDIVGQMRYKLETLLGLNPSFDAPQDELIEDELLQIERYIERYAATQTKPLYFIFDAIDQLVQDEITAALRWAQSAKHGKVMFIVSALPSVALPLGLHFLSAQALNVALMQLEPLTQAEKIAVSNGILKYLHKELDPSLVTALCAAPEAQSPLYLSMMLQRLTMISGWDYAKINESGGDMDSINRYLLQLIENTPDTLAGICAAVLNEASEQIGKTLCDTVIALLATARHGLRLNDLEAIFTQNNLGWSTLNVSLFLKYMSTYFIQKEDGRIDFSHDVIRDGFLQQMDTARYHTMILNHLCTLDLQDPLCQSELLWHAYQKNETALVLFYLSQSDTLSTQTRITAAQTLRDIALQDTPWLVTLLQEAQTSSVTTPAVASFFLFEFYESFDHTPAALALLHTSISLILPLLQAQNNTDALYHESVAHHRLGDIAVSQLALEDAVTSYQAALALRIERFAQQASGENRHALLHTYQALVQAHVQNQDSRMAWAMLQEAVPHCNELLAQPPDTESTIILVDILQSLGSICQEEEAFDEAWGYYQHALALNQTAAETDPSLLLSLDLVYQRIGSFHQAKKEYTAAETAYQESLAIATTLAKKHPTPKHLQCAYVTYVCCATLAAEQGQPDAALAAYQQATELCTIRACKLRNVATATELLHCYQLLAAAYWACGGEENNKTGLIYYKNMGAILQVLANEQRTVAACQSLSEFYQKFAAIHEDFGNFERAWELLLTDLDLCQTMHDQLQQNFTRRALANANHSIGNLYARCRAYPNAITAFEIALALFLECAEDQLSTDALHDVMLCHDRLGVSYQQNEQYDKAQEQFRKMLHITEPVSEALQTLAAHQDRALTYGRIAGLYLAQEQFEKALPPYEFKRDLEESLHMAYESAETRANLAETYREMAALYDKLNQPTLAAEYQQKAQNLTVTE